jgi:hypothetical protein
VGCQLPDTAVGAHLGDDLVKQLAACAELQHQQVVRVVLVHVEEAHHVGVVLKHPHDGDLLDHLCRWQQAVDQDRVTNPYMQHRMLHADNELTSSLLVHLVIVLRDNFDRVLLLGGQMGTAGNLCKGSMADQFAHRVAVRKLVLVTLFQFLLCCCNGKAALRLRFFGFLGPNR